MVKAVVGEETQLKLIEDRLSQSAIPAQVGLVIGKLSSTLDRGFVFDLIPTPQNDSGEPACSIIETFKDDKKKGSKSKSQPADSSMSIDKDWVAEHARQVSRMLVGGMKVVGIYIWISESAFKNSTRGLCQTVKGVADAAPLLETDWEERILVHISYSPRRWTCRNCTLASNITSTNLRPCDFKMGKVLSSFLMFKCIHNFNVRLPIFYENAPKGQTLSDLLGYAISLHAKDLKVAKALIDGKLVVDDEPCTSDSLHEVELLLPFTDDTYVGACSQKDVLGVLSFTGSICSFAYLNSREPISQAVTDIKGDIITSLRSRLDIICDEIDGDSDASIVVGKEGSNEISTDKPVSQLVLHLLRKGCSLSLPRRAFVPWLAGTYVCDYLQQSETVEVLKDHCTELLSIEAPTDVSTILEPENDVPSLVTKFFWDVAVPFQSAIHSPSGKSEADRKGESSNKSMKSANVNVGVAGLILLLSLLVGFVLFVFNK
ncbi:protein odr-4-like [Quillaja saponaria]|uniref:Protein odr-4-like n=1 Tax=Quillaja saponaria TaxID=32244 RepID=A0AAD7LIN3_QUISA|nr:protein odr-4-like [Quillaja saponaria]